MAVTYKVGGYCESWCGRCKLMLGHTIEAIVSGEPARVQCNTCHSQHNWKPYKPGEAPRQVREREERGPRAPQPGQARASHYSELMKGKNLALAKRYSPKDKYAPGDLVEHPSFGLGVATALKDGTKIEVLFQEGAKVLVHGR
jgi:hypothetical protein